MFGVSPCHNWHGWTSNHTCELPSRVTENSTPRGASGTCSPTPYPAEHVAPWYLQLEVCSAQKEALHGRKPYKGQALHGRGPTSAATVERPSPTTWFFPTWQWPKLHREGRDCGNGFDYSCSLTHTIGVTAERSPRSTGNGERPLPDTLLLSGVIKRPILEKKTSECK